jgi:hypothetical protein
MIIRWRAEHTGSGLLVLPFRGGQTSQWRLNATPPVNDVEDLDTSNRADSGCSAAAGGRGEAGHPAHDPRCAPDHHLYGADHAANREQQSEFGVDHLAVAHTPGLAPCAGVGSSPLGSHRNRCDESSLVQR